jgi:hypothetical protein
MVKDVISNAYVMRPPKQPTRTRFGELPVAEHMEVPGRWMNWGEHGISVSCPTYLTLNISPILLFIYMHYSIL